MAIKNLGENKYLVRVTKRINGKRVEKTLTIIGLKGKAVAAEKELENSLVQLKKSNFDDNQRYFWSTAVMDYLSSSEYKLRGTSHYARKTALAAHTKSWNNRPTRDLSRSDVSELMASLKTSDSNKKVILKYIKLVFEEAVMARKIPFNPAKGLPIISDKNNYSKANVLSAMTREEIGRLLIYFKALNYDWYVIFFITYQLGIRFGEARELLFEDIDFNTGKIQINKSWDNKAKKTVPPKNGKSRIVIANHQTLMILNELKLRSNLGSGFVLPRLNQWLKGGATKIIHLAQDHLKIKRTNYHSLRASFITHLLLDGVSVVKVQAIVGHADLKTTMKYIRLCGSDLVGATDSLQIDLAQKNFLALKNNEEFNERVNLNEAQV